jgi:CRP/FNR family cyclic AMP-dependent transcriptional regulator
MPTDEAPFAHLDEQALRSLAPGGAVRSFARNVVVVSEGDPTDSLYVVVSGRVKVFVADENGKEVVVNTIGAGEFFGELVLDGQARAASVMTLEPSRFFVIPQRDAEALLTGNPVFARHLVRKLIGRCARSPSRCVTSRSGTSMRAWCAFSRSRRWSRRAGASCASA